MVQFGKAHTLIRIITAQKDFGVVVGYERESKVESSN